MVDDDDDDGLTSTSGVQVPLDQEGEYVFLTGLQPHIHITSANLNLFLQSFIWQPSFQKLGLRDESDLVV